MHELQALIRGHVLIESIDLKRLVELTEQHQDPESDEYKLLDTATNLILASYLEQAQKYI